MESLAIKSRHDPQITGANMKAHSYQGGGEGEGGWDVPARVALSTNLNVNCAGLHNLRLMRKQQQINLPRFIPHGFAPLECFSLKRHQMHCFNDQ